MRVNSISKLLSSTEVIEFSNHFDPAESIQLIPFKLSDLTITWRLFCKKFAKLSAKRHLGRRPGTTDMFFEASSAIFSINSPINTEKKTTSSHELWTLGLLIPFYQTLGIKKSWLRTKINEQDNLFKAFPNNPRKSGLQTPGAYCSPGFEADVTRVS